MRAYDFWDETGTVESGPYPIASLSLRPSNKATANALEMMFPSDMPIEQQLAVAGGTASPRPPPAVARPRRNSPPPARRSPA